MERSQDGAITDHLARGSSLYLDGGLGLGQAERLLQQLLLLAVFGSSSQAVSLGVPSFVLPVSELLALGIAVVEALGLGAEPWKLEGSLELFFNQSLQVLLSDPLQPLFFISAFYSLVISVF